MLVASYPKISARLIIKLRVGDEKKNYRLKHKCRATAVDTWAKATPVHIIPSGDNSLSTLAKPMPGRIWGLTAEQSFHPDVQAARFFLCEERRGL
jgi:hypothetical protein